jgi:hypothetical protein
MLVFAFAACQRAETPVNLPQPPDVLGFYALEFERAGPIRTTAGDAGTGGADEAMTASAIAWAAPVAIEGVRIEPTGRSGVLRVGNQLFVHAEFVLVNDSDSAIDRLVLLAFQHADFRVGSAISQPLLVSSGAVAPDAYVRRMHPTHALSYDIDRFAAGDAFLGRPGASHFVAYAEEDLPTIDTDTFSFVEGVLPYGFAVGDGAMIEPGQSASVTVAFTYPRGSTHLASLQSFTWNAILVRSPDVRVTQAPAESHDRGWQATLDRARSTAAERTVAIGRGTRVLASDVDCDTLVGLADVRIAGLDRDDADYVGLVPAADVAFPEFVGCQGATP